MNASFDMEKYHPVAVGMPWTVIESVQVQRKNLAKLEEQKQKKTKKFIDCELTAVDYSND